ncbi:MAG: hypothetical protein WBD47_14065 [Phormidesmis sp.]
MSPAFLIIPLLAVAFVLGRITSGPRAKLQQRRQSNYFDRHYY